MFAVFEALGRQYKVTVGDRIKVDRVVKGHEDAPIGATIQFPRVLLIENEGNLEIGKPAIKGAAIEGKIVEQGKEKKVIAFKKKRRKGYMRKVGHRRAFTVVEISSIKAA